MKRILSLTLALVALVSLVSLGLYAANDRVIQSKQLPKAAQLFLAKHFAGRAVSFAKEDRDFSGTTYDVRLADGTELEFTSAGEWKEVDGNHTALPLTFIPAPLVKTIQSQHAGDAIVHIERKRRGYQVELASGLELLFDVRFQLIGYDD